MFLFGRQVSESCSTIKHCSYGTKLIVCLITWKGTLYINSDFMEFMYVKRQNISRYGTTYSILGTEWGVVNIKCLTGSVSAFWFLGGMSPCSFFLWFPIQLLIFLVYLVCLSLRVAGVIFSYLNDRYQIWSSSKCRSVSTLITTL